MLLVTWFYSRVLLQVPCVLVPVLLICMCSCVCSRVRALLAICCSRSRHLQTCCYSPCTPPRPSLEQRNDSPMPSTSEFTYRSKNYPWPREKNSIEGGNPKGGSARSQSFCLTNNTPKYIYTFFRCLMFSFIKLWNYNWIWSSFYHIHFIHITIDYDNNDFSEMSKISILKRILHKKYLCAHWPT